MGKDNGGDLAYLRCGSQGGLLGGGLTSRPRPEAGVEVSSQVIVYVSVTFS